MTKTNLNKVLMLLLQVIVISGCTRDRVDTPPETLLAWTKPVEIEGMMFYNESLTTTPDGGFLVSGYTYHEDNPITHAMVIRFSSGGNRMWWQQYDIDGYSKIYGDYAVQLMTSSGFWPTVPGKGFCAYRERSCERVPEDKLRPV